MHSRARILLSWISDISDSMDGYDIRYERGWPEHGCQSRPSESSADVLTISPVHMKARNDFAGVRGQTASVEFTVYGLECTVYEDGESAQYFNLGKHLLQLSSDPAVKVDRYDVRLLVDEAASIADVEPGQEAEAFDPKELETERYLDLEAADRLEESPAPAEASAEGIQTADAACKTHTLVFASLISSTCSGCVEGKGQALNQAAQPVAQAYAAVGFIYAPEAQQSPGIITNEEQPEKPKPYLPPVSYPAHLADHLPDSDRFFKVGHIRLYEAALREDISRCECRNCCRCPA